MIRHVHLAAPCPPLAVLRCAVCAAVPQVCGPHLPGAFCQHGGPGVERVLQFCNTPQGSLAWLHVLLVPAAQQQSVEGLWRGCGAAAAAAASAVVAVV